MGRYGHWHTDAEGLPAYVYTMNQLTDAPEQAPGPQNRWSGTPEGTHNDTTAKGKREHSFQLGNDRVVVVGSNYGTFRVRSDEGGAKWLNDANADAPGGLQHGGGYGYLWPSGSDDIGDTGDVDGPKARDPHSHSHLVSTAYPAGGDNPRQFGLGYALTSGSSPEWHVQHTLAVPPGDDPCVLTEVAITNRGNLPRNVTWTEIWGSAMVHQLSGSKKKNYGGWSASGDMPSLMDRREFVQGHYTNRFAPLIQNGVISGLVQSRTFTGLASAEEVFFRKHFLGRLPLPNKASLWDQHPPAVWLATVPTPGVNGTTTQMGNSAEKFFQTGGIQNPAGEVAMETDAERGAAGDNRTALIAATSIALPANTTVRLRYVFGYTPVDTAHSKTAADIISSAARHFGSEPLAQTVARQWGARLHHVDVPAMPFLGKEMLWHSFYLHAAVTYDTYFKEYIVDQGTAYRYYAGFQGAVRDPLQHILPMIHTRPDLVRSVLRYSIKEMQKSFYSINATDPVDIPDSILGFGVVRPGTPRPDDFEVYLVWAVSEYVIATKDTAFLSENISLYGGSKTETHSVVDLLVRAFKFTQSVVGLGPHGLLRLLTSDWDDGFGPLVPPSAHNISESVLTSALATSRQSQILT